MKISLKRGIYRIIICCLSYLVICNGSLMQASEAKNESTQKAEAFKQTIRNLEEAIKVRNFNGFNDAANLERKPLSWSACDSDAGVNLSFNEMINKLSKLSENTNIIVNEQPEQLG